MTQQLAQKFFEFLAVFIPTALFFFWAGNRRGAKNDSAQRSQIDSLILENQKAVAHGQLKEKHKNLSDSDALELAIKLGESLPNTKRTDGAR